MPDYVLGYLGARGASRDIVGTTRERMTQYARTAAQGILESQHAHRNPRGTYGTDWGQAVVTARFMDPVITRLQLGDLSDEERQRYIDALSLAADYVLGGNPLGMSFVTGLGSRRPENPLHLDSLVWVKQGRPPVPGIPVYGPVDALPNAEYYEPGREAFVPRFEAHPPMLRYADIQTFVVTNEFGVWDCQAPLAQMFAVLLGPGQMPPRSWLPGQRDHQSPLPTAASREATR
jgi:hypothetical protein